MQQEARGTKRRMPAIRASALTDRNAEWFRLACDEKWWASRDERDITHASLDGVKTGKLKVPEERRSAFYAAIARDVNDEKVFFLNELHTNPTGLMKLFFDLDLKGPTIKGDQFAIEFAQAAQQVARQFFPDLPSSRDDRFDALVVSRDPDCITVGDGIGKHTEGYHVHFPNMVQHRKDVLTIFFQLLQMCKMRLLRAPLENPWDKIMDPNVYDRTGLRLYGSCTIKQCPDCNKRGAVDADCACGGTFQVNGNHRYEHVVAYLRGSDGTPDPDRERQLRESPHAVLLACSVQVPKSMTQPLPLGFVADPASSPNVQNAIAQAAAKTLAKVRTGYERVSTPAVLQVVVGLVRTFARPYETLSITSVLREKPHQIKYEIEVQGVGDKFCFNKIRMENGREVAGDNHRSRNIFFEIFTNRIVQRCRCTCEPDPAAGVRRATTRRCSSSEVDIKCVYLSPEQTKTLFPKFQYEQLSFMYGLYQPDCSDDKRLQTLATFTRYCALKGWHLDSDSHQAVPPTQPTVVPPRGTVVDY